MIEKKGHSPFLSEREILPELHLNQSMSSKPHLTAARKATAPTWEVYKLRGRYYGSISLYMHKMDIVRIA